MAASEDPSPAPQGGAAKPAPKPPRPPAAPGDAVGKPTGEVGGPQGPEPTRYGDWERGGRCIDF
jgi:hypothetical protein